LAVPARRRVRAAHPHPEFRTASLEKAPQIANAISGQQLAA
jgi:hypothetical protein